MAEAFNAHVSNIEEWADERGLAISAPKSTITLYTPRFTQSNTHPITLNNSLLPFEKTPRTLGETSDPHFKFNAHVKPTVTRASPRIEMLKALAGTKWGKQNETKFITYMSLIRSLFMYAALIWFLNVSPFIIKKLQNIQNSVLCIATDCVRMTSINHLHEDTKMLPVQDNLFLISSQYPTRAL